MGISISPHDRKRLIRIAIAVVVIIPTFFLILHLVRPRPGKGAPPVYVISYDIRSPELTAGMAEYEELLRSQLRGLGYTLSSHRGAASIIAELGFDGRRLDHIRLVDNKHGTLIYVHWLPVSGSYTVHSVKDWRDKIHLNTLDKVKIDRDGSGYLYASSHPDFCRPATACHKARVTLDFDPSITPEFVKCAFVKAFFKNGYDIARSNATADVRIQIRWETGRTGVFGGDKARVPGYEFNTSVIVASSKGGGGRSFTFQVATSGSVRHFGSDIESSLLIDTENNWQASFARENEAKLLEAVRSVHNAN